MKKFVYYFSFALIFVHLAALYPSWAPEEVHEEQSTKTPENIEPCDPHKSVIGSFFDTFWSTATSCMPSSSSEEEVLLKTFTPTTHITEQLPEDKELLERMRPLFFDRRNQGLFESIINTIKNKDPDKGTKEKVYAKSINEYDAQEVMLLTQDAYRISSLYFERKDAPLNILYVVGYFRANTPSKEWAAPFAEIFPEYNILSFDWRGYAESGGHPKEFDSNAYNDVQAAIDFLRKTNDKPIVLVGFCLGAALALKATVEAEKSGKNMADALVINCTPSHIVSLKKRAPEAAPNWFLQTLFSYRIVQDSLLVSMMGDLFTLSPIEMIRSINKPILIENYIHDPLAPLREAIDNFLAAPHEKKMITVSDIGHHVRIHSKAPYQYGQAFRRFVEFAGLVPSHENNT